MKITIIQGAFLPVPPAMGGAVEKMWFALGKEFAGRGHEVTQISRQYNNFPVQEIIAGVQHKRIKGYATSSSGLYLKWLDLLYTLKAKSKVPVDAQIIVTNTFWAPIILNTRQKKRCFIDVARIPKGQMKMYKKAGRLRANSNFVLEAIKQEIPASDWGKVVMIPNPLPFEINEQVDLEQKKNVLLYTGRVHPEKGLELLIDAFKHSKSEWQLKIVGPYDVAGGGGGDAYMQSLKKKAEGLSIEFTGPVYDINLLNQYYKEASVFVYPSIAEQGETFGLAPLEAMAWGCVPVVSNLSCFRDFINHEINGLIFDHRSGRAVLLLVEAIQNLIADKSLRHLMATAAIEVRRSHSVSLIASRFLSEFEKVLTELKE